jgi:hypothetical protein
VKQGEKSSGDPEVEEQVRVQGSAVSGGVRRQQPAWRQGCELDRGRHRFSLPGRGCYPKGCGTRFVDGT